jgi:hypothetical protein
MSAVASLGTQENGQGFPLTIWSARLEGGTAVIEFGDATSYRELVENRHPDWRYSQGTGSRGFDEVRVPIEKTRAALLRLSA